MKTAHRIILSLWLGLTALLAQGAVSPVATYFGMCDASAAVALDEQHFAVANDEDNVIRIYRSDQDGLPVQTFDFSKVLKVQGKEPETDLEGACWINDQIFWITSHGRNQEGKYRPNRHFLFATRYAKQGSNANLILVGQPYRSLVPDLLREPRLRPFNLDAASRLAPKTRGALNIEGLCATPDQHLLVGFRNPVPQGRALLVPISNPQDLIAGKPAKFGDPILLDLEGLGVRDIVLWQEKYFIIAGAYDGGGKLYLYQWKPGEAKAEKLSRLDVKKLNPEALIVYPEKLNAIQLLSDDGNVSINGVPCKKLAIDLEKRFRSAWITLED